jgi:hypothetical protein
MQGLLAPIHKMEERTRLWTSEGTIDSARLYGRLHPVVHHACGQWQLSGPNCQARRPRQVM